MSSSESAGVRCQWPILGVGGLVFDGGRVLLVQRGARPAKGLWSIPGGKVRRGETLVEAVRREMLEETGMRVSVGRLVAVYERIPGPEIEGTERHFVVLDYLCDAVGGRLLAGDDAAKADWFGLEDLAHLPLTPGAEEVIRKGLRIAAGDWSGAESICCRIHTKR